MNARQQLLPAGAIEDWPEEFFIDLAVGVNSFVEICDNYGIDEQTALGLETDPAFNRRLRIAKAVVEDDGRAFKSRCRVAVTESVHRIIHMMHDVDVPASTQLDAFKTLVKFGELEPKRDESSMGAGPSLVLNIVGPSGEQMVVGQGVAENPQKKSHTLIHSTDDVQDADFSEVASSAPVLTIAPPVAKSTSTAFGAE